MAINYDDMSVAELGSVIADAQNAIQAKKEQEKEAVRVEAVSLIESRGYSVEDIFPSGKAKKKTKAPVTHRDPENPKNTWTGKGRKPKWLEEALMGGKELSEFRV